MSSISPSIRILSHHSRINNSYTNTIIVNISEELIVVRWLVDMSLASKEPNKN